MWDVLVTWLCIVHIWCLIIIFTCADLLKDIHGLRSPGQPMLVHCSAGVGRSGVLVLVDYLMASYDAGEVGAHTRMHARTHTCTHARMPAHMHAHTHACTHTHMHTHVHMRTHKHTHIHAHTHTHTHTYKHTHTYNNL